MKLGVGKGQQVIEYLLLFTIVVIILILFIRPGGPFRTVVNQTLELTLNQIDQEAAKFNQDRQ